MNLTSKIMTSLCAAAVTLTLAAMPAEARGKQFCRNYAERYANRHANGGDVLAGTALGAATGALIGLAIDGGRGAGRGAIIGGVGGTVAGGVHTSEKWRRVYRRAYADCRASQDISRSGAGWTMLEVRPEDPGTAAALWCLSEYYAELDRRFDGGFNPDDKDYAGTAAPRPPHGVFLVAWLDGAAVGCGALMRHDGVTGEIKRMWVAPAARGKGIASGILAALEDAGRGMGLRAIRLDTNRALKEAQAFYGRAGYGAIARYSGNPYAHHWFEKILANS